MVVGSQSFFKTLNESAELYNQKVQRFDNGDILIGDSSLESLHRGGTNGEIYLTRFFECGDIKWSFGYHVEEGYLEFRDFVINTDEEVFVYGSYFVALRESIFLLKVNGRNGALIDFKLFNPSTVDHFTYKIDISEDRLMVYGLLLDFDTQKRGFVAFFSSKLAFIEARSFAPFDSNGSISFTQQGDIVGWSGSYHFLLDGVGKYKWATTMQARDYVQVVGGPYESEGGYIFEGAVGDKSFFYKLSATGSLLWTSRLFHTSGSGVALSALEGGSFLGTYGYPRGEGTLLSQLVLSPTGGISEQRHLDIGQSLSIGNLYQSISLQKTVTIVGNRNPFSLAIPEVEDFFLQYQVGEDQAICLNPKDFVDVDDNDLAPQMAPYIFESQSMVMREEAYVRIRMVDFSFGWDDVCNTTSDTEQKVQTRQLECDEIWEVSLPNQDYKWDDIDSRATRRLSDPGIYSARSTKCVDPDIVEYHVQKPECACSVYMPNVISHGVTTSNHQLAIESDCQIQELSLRLYNRWGQLVYEDQDAGSHLSPFDHQDSDNIPAGVYVCIARYQLIDIHGQQQEGMMVQDVTVIR